MKKDVFLLLLCFVALTVCAQDPVEYNPSAFYDCQNLKDVYCLGDYIWAAYGNIPYFERDLLDGMTLHVLPSSFFSYHPESDYLWSEYPWSEFKKTVIMESDELSWLEDRLHRK